MNKYEVSGLLVGQDSFFYFPNHEKRDLSFNGISSDDPLERRHKLLYCDVAKLFEDGPTIP